MTGDGGEAHLSDLALQEWGRFAAVRLAPEGTEEAGRHLEGCATCREQVARFVAMDRLMDPFGSPAPVDPRPRRFRLVLWGLGVVGAAVVAWLVL